MHTSWLPKIRNDWFDYDAHQADIDDGLVVLSDTLVVKPGAGKVLRKAQPLMSLWLDCPSCGQPLSSEASSSEATSSESLPLSSEVTSSEALPTVDSSDGNPVAQRLADSIPMESLTVGDSGPPPTNDHPDEETPRPTYSEYAAQRMPEESLQQDHLPEDSLPQDPLPEESLPQDHLPEEPLQQESLPQQESETQTEDTVAYLRDRNGSMIQLNNSFAIDGADQSRVYPAGRGPKDQAVSFFK